MGKVLFVSDLHGNRYAYENAFNLARDRNLDTVILGGDLTPKKIAVKLKDQEPEDDYELDEEVSSGEIIPGEIIPLDLVKEDLKSRTYNELERKLKDSGYIIHPVDNAFYNLEDMLMENTIINKLFDFFNSNPGIKRHSLPFEMSEEEKEVFSSFIVQSLRDHESTLSDNTKKRMGDRWNLYLTGLKNEFQNVQFFRLLPSNTLWTYFCFRDKLPQFEEQYHRLQELVDTDDEKVSKHVKGQLKENLRDIRLAIRMAENYSIELLEIIRNLGTYTSISSLMETVNSSRVPEQGQREFIENYLRNLLMGHRQRNPNSKVFAIMGNDDLTSIEESVKNLDKEGLLCYLNNSILQFHNGVYIAGYPFVMDSYGAFYPGWEKKEDEMERDLEELAKQSDPKKTVYVFHSPPYDTSLDIAHNGKHMGSKAVRRFVERDQPLIVLSGHVHESFRKTGKVMDRIGETPCYNAGGEHDEDKLCAVVIDINNPREYERIYEVI